MASCCDRWHLCKAGRFSYGESPRTPPLEGISLHRWNNSVERPWGILSLFTTCLRLQSPCHSLWRMWTTPWKSTLRREEPKEMPKWHKPQKEMGRRCKKKTWKEAFKVKGAKEKAMKSSNQGRKLPLKKNNSTMKKNLVTEGQRKSHNRENKEGKEQ